MLSSATARPLPPPSSGYVLSAAPAQPEDSSIWASIARAATSFKESLGDPRFFTMVLLCVAVLNFVTVLLALFLHRLTRRPDPEFVPRSPQFRAVSHVRGKSI